MHSQRLSRNPYDSQQERRSKDYFNLGELSPKALDYFMNSYAPINIAHGAIRSSKTITSTLRWLKYLAESPHKEFLQSGKTRGSLYRNVLRDQFKIMDTLNISYDYKRYDGILEIEDNTVWLIGYRDERVSDVILGMTIGGWYGDEVNTYPRNAVEETLDRCSLQGSKVYWSMNPDNPYHYINTDYIQNKLLRENGDVLEWQFTLDDNLHLPESYKEQLKRRYPKGSVQYKRKILGMWVVAEGIIYDRFIESQHTFKEPPLPDYDLYVLSTDYGISTVTVHGLFGIKRSYQGNKYHLLREYYYDAEKKGKQLTDRELVDEAMKLFKPVRLDAWFIPHDATSLKSEARTRTHRSSRLPLFTYTPKTLEDIYQIQHVISEDRFLIHESCKNSISQIQSYAWDRRAQERGEDKPLKINDHCPDMWRGAILGSRKKTLNPYSQSMRRYKYS